MAPNQPGKIITSPGINTGDTNVTIVYDGSRTAEPFESAVMYSARDDYPFAELDPEPKKKHPFSKFFQKDTKRIHKK